jgi:uncharacterized protein (TIGR03382 family)
MSRLALASLIAVALVSDAAANGRPSATSTIHFRLGHESDIYAGMTFGLVVSHDNGVTWRWMCEKAVGYGGMYDPYYAYTSSGALFATTFDGLRVNSDSCTFAPTQFGSAFVSANGIGPDNAVYVALADPAQPNATPPHAGDSNVYKTTDNGVSYPVMAMPGRVGDWWQSIVVAPANAAHVYLSGFRFDAPNPKTFLLFKSTDGGASYVPMSTTGFTTSSNSQIELVGVTSNETLYARVTFENGTNTEGIYKSTTGGASWTKILTKPEAIHFRARANGDLVAATQLSGTQKSGDGGITWTDVTGAPHINCLYENTAGELWACTLNYDLLTTMGVPPIPGDGFGIMKTTDLTTWTGVLKFQDILEPVDCAAGTTQHDECLPTWCGLKAQLGITSNVIDCSVPVDGTAPPPKGCCDATGGSGPAALGFTLFVGGLLARRRRASPRPSV